MKKKYWIPLVLYALVAIAVIIFEDFFRQPMLRGIIAVLSTVSLVVILIFFVHKLLYRK